ncbi:MAG TPA: hypothetical protein VGD42_03885 [Lysobacter sp.]
MTESTDDGRHDFDFFFGRWQIQNQRLQQRHVGSNDWDEFEASIDCRSILGGLGNIDEYRTEYGGGIVGISLRLFNTQAREWSDAWANRRDGVLGAPALGRFVVHPDEGKLGTFIGRDRDGERAVLSRAQWSHITPDSLHWDQAFSTDEGKTWETNWRMQMTRVG